MSSPTAVAGDDDQFSDEFKCCVCLDLIYKPVVLACGHISCFWCVFEAMDAWQESRCPICRQPYYHFPNICWLLHFLLLNLYPQPYQKREIQVTEEEKIIGTSSPQFENHLPVTHCSEQIPLQDCSISESLESDNKCSTEITKNGTVEGNCSKQVAINDLLCAICKELLCRPAVLNCGHVFCETCIIDSSNEGEGCRCPVCRSMHPNGFPKVCLVLEGFLEHHVSQEYAARKLATEKLKTCDQGTSSTVSTQCSSIPMNNSKAHFGFGCDCCGMYPLIGDRYKCKDCYEKFGFDLCEDCYKNSSNTPGRFNQQHTPDHKFEVLESSPIIYVSADFPEYEIPDMSLNTND